MQTPILKSSLSEGEKIKWFIHLDQYGALGVFFPGQTPFLQPVTYLYPVLSSMVPTILRKQVDE